MKEYEDYEQPDPEAAGAAIVGLAFLIFIACGAIAAFFKLTGGA